MTSNNLKPNQWKKFWYDFFSQALYQKAELHYQQREYEMALVFFSKGSKQRPDMKAFQEGLERTQDAINRSDSGV